MTREDVAFDEGSQRRNIFLLHAGNERARERVYATERGVGVTGEALQACMMRGSGREGCVCAR